MPSSSTLRHCLLVLITVVCGVVWVSGVHAMGVDRMDLPESEAESELTVDAAWDDASADDESESDSASMAMPRPPLPPPPPFDEVYLQIEQQIRAVEKSQLRAEAEAEAEVETEIESETDTQTKATAHTHDLATASGAARMRLRGQDRTTVKGASNVDTQSKAKAKATANAKGKVNAHSKAKAQDPFPDQPFTYKDVGSPPEWLVPEESEPAGPTTKPPPVPQMIPPPPPVPFPTYNYHDPNSAGPFSQYAPGVQGWGYDGGYAGPYDGFSMYGHTPNAAQTKGWLHPGIPRTAAQIAAATAASQYHPYGPPAPLYALGSPPPDGAASWVPLGAFLKPGTYEGGAGDE